MLPLTGEGSEAWVRTPCSQGWVVALVLVWAIMEIGHGRIGQLMAQPGTGLTISTLP